MNILNRLKTFLWVGFCVSGCLLFSCVDDTGEIGSEFQNPEDKVIVMNDSSIQLNTYTAKRKNFIKLGPEYFLLGTLNDPRYGSFQHSFMTEVGYEKPILNNSTVVDSIKFYVNYSLRGANDRSYPGIYGDSTIKQTILMYELRNDTAIIGIDSLENSENTINTFVDRTKPLGSFSFYPRISDTLLRISLPIELGERLLDTAKYSFDTTNIASLQAFQENLFRGIYFEAQPIAGIGAVATLGVGDSTGMHLFYSDTIARVASYYIYSSSYRCNTTLSSNEKINSVDFEQIPTAANEEEFFYVKNSNGYESIIKLSGLQNWADSTNYFTINRAYLTLIPDYENEADSMFAPIDVLSLNLVNDLSAGDFTRSSVAEYYDSFINYSDTIYEGYQINIKSTLNYAIKNGDDELSFVLTTPPNLNFASATRTTFKGAKNTEKALKLHVTYTKLNVE